MHILPKKLGKEPLIEAIFEMRFESSSLDAGSILPGLLFRKIDAVEKIEGLPISQIPKEVRDKDPNLQFAPINRLHCKGYLINIGDRSISIALNYPYPGWVSFKDKISHVIDILNKEHIISSVERYSLRYINLLPASNVQEQVSLVNFDMTIAGHKLEKEAFQIRIEIPKNHFIQIIQANSFASAKLPGGEVRNGLIIDIDTIANQPNIPFHEFFNNFSDKLNLIHQAAKEIFFACLKENTIKQLDPQYEP